MEIWKFSFFDSKVAASLFFFLRWRMFLNFVYIYMYIYIWMFFKFSAFSALLYAYFKPSSMKWVCFVSYIFENIFLYKIWLFLLQRQYLYFRFLSNEGKSTRFPFIYLLLFVCTIAWFFFFFFFIGFPWKSKFSALRQILSKLLSLRDSESFFFLYDTGIL